MRNLKLVWTFSLLFITSPVFAVPFVNGDFSSGLSGWNDSSSTGTVQVIAGEAQLDTGHGDDLYSSVLVQGDDGFFSFSSPITLGASDQFLNFDASFADLGVDGTESGGSFFTDFLTVSVYDSLDFSYDLYFTQDLDFTLGSGFTRINLDVSSLAGRDIALSFELSDENDGLDSRVLLDNISFSATPAISATVPEPASIFMLFTGLLLMVSMRGSRYFSLK